MAKTYKAKQGFIKRTIAGETLLVPVGKTTQEFNGMVMLNETGDFLWELLKEEHTKEELIEAVKKEFDAPAEEIASDVAEFIENGIKDGMIIEG